MLGMLVLSACSQDPTAELRQWAEQGDVHAQYHLGDMYENGRGVPQDYSEAVQWYRALTYKRTRSSDLIPPLTGK